MKCRRDHAAYRTDRRTRLAAAAHGVIAASMALVPLAGTYTTSPAWAHIVGWIHIPWILTCVALTIGTAYPAVAIRIGLPAAVSMHCMHALIPTVPLAVSYLMLGTIDGQEILARAALSGLLHAGIALSAAGWAVDASSSIIVPRRALPDESRE